MEQEKNIQFRTTLDMLVKYAYDDFKLMAIDLPTHQSTYLRTYLWLSTLLIAFNISLYIKLLTGIEGIFPKPTEVNFFFYSFSSLSLFLLLITFSLGVDTLRGKTEVRRPFGYFTEHIADAWDEAGNDKEMTRPSLLYSLTSEIEKQERECSQIGKKLRLMSRLILLSVALTIVAAANLIFSAAMYSPFAICGQIAILYMIILLMIINCWEISTFK